MVNKDFHIHQPNSHEIGLMYLFHKLRNVV